MGVYYGFTGFDGVEFCGWKPTMEQCVDAYIGERLAHAVENDPHMSAEAFEATRATIIAFAKLQPWRRMVKIPILRFTP
jgi:hypothetical protein